MKTPSDSLPPAKKRMDIWGPARLLLWSWWLWMILSVLVTAWKDFVATIPFFILTLITFFFQPARLSQGVRILHRFPVDSDEFLATISGAMDKGLTQGNRIDILSNGEEIFPAMIGEIRRARRTVTVEAYILWEGMIGLRFAQALAERARAGVQVKILLDAVGSSGGIGEEIVHILESSGCQLEWYHPITWYSMRRLQNRTHRKSVIVDGMVGFTGGAGIADHWDGRAQDRYHWRDTHVRIEGPAVSTLQSGFTHNWLGTTGELIVGEEFFPSNRENVPNGLPALSVLSSPEMGASAVRIMYDLSIACAREKLYIANPYFVPDNTAIDALIEARRRGVDVKILVTGIHNDSKLARAISVGLYGELLEAGVEVHEYDRTMLHHKIMVVDGIWSTVGTTNFDSRSFSLNEENNLCIHDRGFAESLEKIFLRDLADSHAVSYPEWQTRGPLQKTLEALLSILREQV